MLLPTPLLHLRHLHLSLHHLCLLTCPLRVSRFQILLIRRHTCLRRDRRLRPLFRVLDLLRCLACPLPNHLLHVHPLHRLLHRLLHFRRRFLQLSPDTLAVRARGHRNVACGFSSCSTGIPILIFLPFTLTESDFTHTLSLHHPTCFRQRRLSDSTTRPTRGRWVQIETTLGSPWSSASRRTRASTLVSCRSRRPKQERARRHGMSANGTRSTCA